MAPSRALDLCNKKPFGCPEALLLTTQPKARRSRGPWAIEAMYILLHSAESLTVVRVVFPTSLIILN